VCPDGAITADRPPVIEGEHPLTLDSRPDRAAPGGNRLAILGARA